MLGNGGFTYGHICSELRGVQQFWKSKDVYAALFTELVQRFSHPSAGYFAGGICELGQDLEQLVVYPASVPVRRGPLVRILLVYNCVLSCREFCQRAIKAV